MKSTLNEILHLVPKDLILRKISMNTAQNINNLDDMRNENFDISNNANLISSIINITFASATGSFELLDSDIESLHQYFLSHGDSNEAALESAKIFDCYDV